MNTNMNDSLASLQSHTGVFLMAHGAPDAVSDIPQYLKNIRPGLESSPKIVSMITERYQAIGGASPLLEVTRSQAVALQSFLDQNGRGRLKVYFGMRNWSPYIRDVVEVALEDGVKRILALCLSPQYSRWSTELYYKALRQALGQCSADIEVAYIDGWCHHPLLIDAYVERYHAAMDKLRAMGEEEVYTVFTVHSIPSESIAMGDPYEEDYEKTMRAIVKRVNPHRWFKAYQSQGMISVPWLGPRVEDVLDKIARQGKKTVLIVPVGFVSDHIEVLYDIDVGFKNYASERNLKLFRTESLNESPQFIETLGALVWQYMI